MRERHAHRTVRKVTAAQTALRVVAESSLAQALALEKARDVLATEAQARFDQAFEEWRLALNHGAIDATLLGLFAQAPARRETELKQAHGALEKARGQTAAQRLRHGEITARLRRLAQLQKRIEKRLDRRREEKALAILEQHIGWAPQ